MKHLTPISETELESRYDSFLDDAYGEVNIGGYTYSTSHALKEVDPIAYREGLNNWIDSEIDNTIKEVEGEYYNLEDIDNLDDDSDE